MASKSGTPTMGEDMSRQASDSMQELVGFGLFALLVFILAGKFIPMIAIGIVFGFILFSSRYQITVKNQVTAYIASVIASVIAFVLLFGIPIQVEQVFGNGFHVPGVIWGKAFDSAILYMVGLWNDLISIKDDDIIGRMLNLALGHFKFSSAQVTYDKVRLYAWGILPVGVLFSSVMLAYGSIKSLFKKSKRPSKQSTNAFKRSFTALPLMLISFPIYVLFSFWAEAAFKNIRNKTPVIGKVINVLLLMLGAFLLDRVLPYGMAFVIEGIAGKDIKIDPFSSLAFPILFVSVMLAPFLSILFGSVLGLMGKYGDKAFEFVLGKNIPKAGEKILTLPKPNITGKGFLLGQTFQGYPYELSERNLSLHVEMIAPTGSGKTNTLKNLIADRIKRGHGVIFLDFKAEFDVVSWMYRASKSANREKDFRLVSLSDRELSVPYNPLENGTASEIHSRLMRIMVWSNDFYRGQAHKALLVTLRALTEYRDITGEKFHIGHVYDLLHRPGALRMFCDRLKATVWQKDAANKGLTSGSNTIATLLHDVSDMADALDRPSGRNDITGLITNLSSIIYSAAGPLMTDDLQGKSFQFQEAIEEGKITCILVNSLMLQESADSLGKIILQDLMGLVGRRYGELKERRREGPPVTLIIDEFASFAVPEFASLLDRIRGAGIGVIMAHQSRADLRAITPEFQDRIEANSGTVIVSGVKSSEDAEYYAGLVGTQSTEKETVQVENNLIFGEVKSGMKSVREVEEYVIHPNDIKKLMQGEVFVVSRTVDQGFGLVKVPEAPEFKKIKFTGDDLKAALKAIRTEYMNNTGTKYLQLGRINQKDKVTPNTKQATSNATSSENSNITPNKATKPISQNNSTTKVVEQQSDLANPAQSVHSNEPEIWS